MARRRRWPGSPEWRSATHYEALKDLVAWSGLTPYAAWHESACVESSLQLSPGGAPLGLRGPSQHSVVVKNRLVDQWFDVLCARDLHVPVGGPTFDIGPPRLRLSVRSTQDYAHAWPPLSSRFYGARRRQ
jgi:hypothetical protein